MLLGFKTELKPNNKQKTLFAKHCGVARHAWNIGLSAIKFVLEHNKNNPEQKLKIPSAIDLHKWLVAAIKPDYPWYYEVSKCAPQQALRNLSTTLSDFFRKKKIRGKVVSFPRYKKKGKHDSFYLEGSLKTNHFAIKLPKIGWVRTYERLPQGITPKNVTISRQADKWFVSFKVEIRQEVTQKSGCAYSEVSSEYKRAPRIREKVGVDLGVKNLATLSSGEVFEGAKAYRKLEKKLSRMQWLNRNKTIGSNNWKKAQIQIARLHKKIVSIRKDNLHKLTTYLAKNHGIVVIENLNVAGMMANHKLAKAIQDMGFYEFTRQLKYKAELYGSKIIQADRWFPSSKTCSNCGCKKDNLAISERIFNCLDCGFSIDRDLNASLMLEKLA